LLGWLKISVVPCRPGCWQGRHYQGEVNDSLAALEDLLWHRAGSLSGRSATSSTASSFAATWSGSSITAPRQWPSGWAG